MSTGQGGAAGWYSPSRLCEFYTQRGQLLFQLPGILEEDRTQSGTLCRLDTAGLVYQRAAPVEYHGLNSFHFIPSVIACFAACDDDIRVRPFYQEITVGR